jgi:hypothetical protein
MDKFSTILTKDDLKKKPKFQVFNLLMLMDRTMVFVDPMHKDVDLPDYLMGAKHVALEFGYNMEPTPIEDLTVSPLALAATLTFNRTPYTVFIPWDAVEAITDNKGVGVYYGTAPAAVSKEDLLHLQETNEKERVDTELTAHQRRKAFKVLNGGKS